jgi:hypothetical protein
MGVQHCLIRTHRPPNTQMGARIAVPPWRNLTQDEQRTSVMSSLCMLVMHACNGDVGTCMDHTHLPADVEHVEAGRGAVSLVVEEDRARGELVGADVEPVDVQRGDEPVVPLLRRSWPCRLLCKLSDNKAHN